jgi:hypothetical protein
MLVDQAWARARQRVDPPRSVPPGASTGLALISVNFSTTRYLKLMLLTLCEQERLGIIQQVVIVDNRSRDGGASFLRRLDERVPRLHLVENRVFLNHARGMRAGVRHLDRIDHGDENPPSVLLFCDPDVVFRRSTALLAIARAAHDERAALVGEWRPRGEAVPSIQASFMAVARDVHARRDISPLEHHGSPAYRQQRSIWGAGLPVVDFPSNHGGHVLHRGRTGVAAARALLPLHPYARVTRYAPHYMGVPGGAAIWAEVEARHAALLGTDAEPMCLQVLAEGLSALGTDRLADEAPALP